MSYCEDAYFQHKNDIFFFLLIDPQKASSSLHPFLIRFRLQIWMIFQFYSRELDTLNNIACNSYIKDCMNTMFFSIIVLDCKTYGEGNNTNYLQTY